MSIGSRFTAGLLLLALAPLHAQDREAPASALSSWEWSDDERIAARFDPVHVAARKAAAAEKLGASPVPQTGDDSCPVDGDLNPELLLPWELFNRLIGAGFNPLPESRVISRQLICEKASSLRCDSDFWTQLSKVAHDFLVHERAGRALGERLRALPAEERRRIAAELEAAPSPSCEARARALEAARKEFGAQAFDRFLYEAVAPGMGVTTSCDASWATQLQLIGRGCR